MPVFNRYKMPGNVIGFPSNWEYPKIVLRTTIYIFFYKKEEIMSICYCKTAIQNISVKPFLIVCFNHLEWNVSQMNLYHNAMIYYELCE